MDKWLKAKAENFKKHLLNADNETKKFLEYLFTPIGTVSGLSLRLEDCDGYTWNSKGLLYIKTDKIYQDLELEIDRHRIVIDTSQVKQKDSNIRIYYSFEALKPNRLIVRVETAPVGVHVEELAKELEVPESVVKKAIKKFVTQREIDYYLCPDVKQFVSQQAQYWELKNNTRLDSVLINKLAQEQHEIESVALRAWYTSGNVVAQRCVITSDKIPQVLLQKIRQHTNYKLQELEWEELGVKDSKFLPIDSKYFPELENDLIELVKEPDGYLVKCDSYRALRTLLPQFKGKIQTIYIDPPFNLNAPDTYLYRSNYDSSSWATLLENRLKIAKEWLADTGSIFVRCDYNGNYIVRSLLDQIFGGQNFRNEIVLRKANTQSSLPSRFNPGTDFLFFYYNSYDKGSYLFNPIFKKKDKPRSWVKIISTKENKFKNWCFVDNIKFVCPAGYHWNLKQEKIDELYQKGELIALTNDGDLKTKMYLTPEETKLFKEKLQKGMIYKLENESIALDSNWTDINSYSNVTTQINYFPTENSEKLVARVVKTTSLENHFVLDFFLGSGTTTAVAHKLKRKWVGIEMGEHFYTVVLPRMKKVLAYDKSGISADKEVKQLYNKDNAGGSFVYLELESFSDAIGHIFNT